MNSKKLIDFDRSYSNIGYCAENTWRQKIICKMTIKNKDGTIIDEVYLNYACLAESVYSEEKMLHGRYTWAAIITKEHIKEIRIGPHLELSDSAIKNREDLNVVDIMENSCHYESIDEDRLFSVMQSNIASPIVCEISYKLKNGCASILFPANYINYNIYRRMHQFDIGPVLFVCNSVDTLHDNMIENIKTAFCAFSNLGVSTEFNTLNKTYPQVLGRYKKIKAIVYYLISLIPTVNTNLATLFYNENNKIDTINKIYIKIEE